MHLVRLHRERSPQALAARGGVTAPWRSMIEHGRHAPRAFTLQGLAQALGVSSEYVLGLSETSMPTTARAS